MPRTQLAYAVPDVSVAARSLRDQLSKLERLPSHVELLNMLARAAGYRNFQHFRAEAASGVAAAAPIAGPSTFDAKLVERAARYFGPDGMFLQWPSRERLAKLCIWVLWSRIPAGASFSEIEISELIDDWHGFGDRALLRRALFDYGLVSRTVDGSEYRPVEQLPPAELGPLLARIGLG